MRITIELNGAAVAVSISQDPPEALDAGGAATEAADQPPAFAGPPPAGSAAPGPDLAAGAAPGV